MSTNITALGISTAASPPPAQPVAPVPQIAAPQTPAFVPEPAEGGRSPSRKEVEQAVSQVRHAVELQAPNELSFSIDQDTGHTIVRIIDQKTGDTLRQIPAKEMLEIAKAIGKMEGLLVKQKV